MKTQQRDCMVGFRTSGKTKSETFALSNNLSVMKKEGNLEDTRYSTINNKGISKEIKARQK